MASAIATKAKAKGGLLRRRPAHGDLCPGGPVVSRREGVDVIRKVYEVDPMAAKESGGAGVYRLLAGSRGFLVPIGSSGAIFAVIDSVARPAIYYRHGEEGRSIVRRGNSPRRGKRKLLSPKANLLAYLPNQMRKRRRKPIRNTEFRIIMGLIFSNRFFLFF